MTNPNRLLYELEGAQGQRFSPYVWRTKMLLAHLGIDYQSQGVGFTDIAQAAGGGFKTVPILCEAEVCVSDSWAIAETIIDKTDGALFGGPAGRSFARFLHDWSSLGMLGPILRLNAVTIWQDQAPKDQDYFRTSREKRFGKTLEELCPDPLADLKSLSRVMRPLDSALGGQPFFGGQAPVYADYLLFGNVQFARCTGPHDILSQNPSLEAWFERCLNLHGQLGRSEPSYTERHAQ